MCEKRTYHLVFEFAVEVGEPSSNRMIFAAPEEDEEWAARVAAWDTEWDAALRQTIAAIKAAPHRLDALAVRACVYALGDEVGFDGPDLYPYFGLPRDDGQMLAYLLGMNLPPATRAFLKDLQARDRNREDDTAGVWLDDLGTFLTVQLGAVDHHRARHADPAHA